MAFAGMILDKMPSAVQIPLKMLGLHAFIEGYVEKFNEVSAEVNNKEVQKEIERNRPSQSAP